VLKKLQFFYKEHFIFSLNAWQFLEIPEQPDKVSRRSMEAA